MAAIKTFIEGKWVVAGENVNKFERAFGKLFGAKFVQMVNSGSSANLVLISALKKYYGWEDGDEVIVGLCVEVGGGCVQILRCPDFTALGVAVGVLAAHRPGICGEEILRSPEMDDAATGLPYGIP